MKATLFDGHKSKPFTDADQPALAADSPFTWIDIHTKGQHDPKLAPFLSSIGFSDVMAAYTSRSDGSGMFQQFDQNLVGATWAAADRDTDPVLVHFVWNADRLVTIRAGAEHAMHNVRREIEARGQQLFEHPTVVPGVVLELILASVEHRLTGLASRVDALDAAIIEGVKPDQLPQLRTLRQELTPLASRLPTYFDNVNDALIDPNTLPGMDAQGAQYLQAYCGRVQSTVARVSDIADAMRNAAQDYQTEVGNKQGQRINQLTVVSILFLPVTFLTGYFGMNFQWLVNETQSFAVWFLLGVLAPTVIVLVSAAVLTRRGYRLDRAVAKVRRSVHDAPAKNHPA